MKKDLQSRLNEVWVNVFGQRKLLKDKKSGIMHVVMFYGFIIIQFGAIDLFIKGLAPGHHLPLPAYPVFTLIQEITVFAVLLSALYAYYRRFVEKLPRLKRGWKAGLVVWFLTSLMLSILLSTAFEQLWLGQTASWATPISSLIAAPFAPWLSEGAAAVLFYVFWWAACPDPVFLPGVCAPVEAFSPHRGAHQHLLEAAGSSGQAVPHRL